MQSGESSKTKSKGSRAAAKRSVALAELIKLEQKLAALQEENEGLRGTIDSLNAALNRDGARWQRE